MQSAYSKHAYVLQVFEWLPEYYTNTSLPEEMPEDLKDKIIHTLSSSPKQVSVSLRRHKNLTTMRLLYWKCIMTLTSNIHTRQAVNINVEHSHNHYCNGNTTMLSLFYHIITHTAGFLGEKKKY
jgi:hypothetical protein